MSDVLCFKVNRHMINLQYNKFSRNNHFNDGAVADAMSRVARNRIFAYAKTKTQISFAVTAKQISAFVFATYIVESLYFLHPKFQASSPLLWLYSPVYVGPGRKPRRPVFSQRGFSTVTEENG